MKPARFRWTIATCIAALTLSQSAIAQITPDDTLGSERSTIDDTFNGVPLQVEINGVVNPVDVIQGGARRGGNLFHSFSQFNVALDRGTYFFVPDAQVQNVLARVTGSSPSNILGRLGTFQSSGGEFFVSTANLFLINPNGILFGNNASLAIGGAFIATTANAVRFGDRAFSATAPEQVTDVLQVNPSAFLFNRIPTGDITVRANAPLSAGSNFAGLQTQNTQPLILLGGNVNLEGGQLNAFGGRVEIGAVAGTGVVGLNSDSSLSIPASVERADVQLSNAAKIDVSLLEQGNIGITANNIRLREGSQILAGVDTGGGSRDSQAGNIDLNATGAVELSGDSRVRNTVNEGFTGNSGDVNITARSLSAIGGSRISTSTFGIGDAGSVNLQVTDWILLDNSNIFSSVEKTGEGSGGDVTVSSNGLELRNGAQLVGSTRGNGNAGNVTVQVRDRITMSGFTPVRDFRTSIFTSVELGATGSGGNLFLSANTLEILDGARLNASTNGQGKAGNITITVGDRILLDNGDIFSSVGATGKGNGGDVTVSSNGLELRNGAQLVGGTSGQGTAGDVTIAVRDRVSLSGLTPARDFRTSIFTSVDAGATGSGGNLFLSANTLEILDGARLNASTNGQGKAGNITITVGDRILLDNGGIFSSVGATGNGNGGNLTVSANVLELRNGAQLVASTQGTGSAGDVTIAVRDRITMSGLTPAGDLRSGILTSVELGATGSGGNLFLSANTLEILDGARLNASTNGKGNAGDVTIAVRDRILLDNGDIFNRVDATGEGRGGNLSITANVLELRNGAQFDTSTSGKGNAGDVTIQAQDRVTLSGLTPDGQFRSGILINVGEGATGSGGNLSITANTLEILDNARINASTSGTGNAGNVTIAVRDGILLDNGDIFNRVDATGEGRGGSLSITANVLELKNGAQLSVGTSGRGDAGSITLGNATQPIRSMSISGTNSEGFSSALFTSTVGGRGGNVNIDAEQIRISDGGVIDARTFSTGDSGSIDIRTSEMELLRGGQVLALTQSSGAANNIRINAAARLFISGVDSTYDDRVNRFGINRAAPISAVSGIYTRSTAPENAGTAGSIFLTAPRIELDDRARIDAQSTTVDGGNITIRALDRLVLRNNSQITATAGTAEGFGDGGNINIDARFIIAIPKENSDITANAFRGTGGRVTLNVSEGVLGIEARSQPTGLSDITASSAQGTTGIVTLNTPDTNSLQNSLSRLSQREINTNELLANSCIVRDRQNGSFYITGTGGLPTKPTELSDYPTGTIQPPVTSDRTLSIAEPQGIYQLPNGKLVMVRECTN